MISTGFDMSSSFDFCSEHIWRILNKTEVVRVGEYCEGYPRPHSAQTKFPRLSLVNILLPAFSLAPDHPSPSLLWVSCGNADWEKLQILGLKFLTVLKFSRPRRQPFKFHTNYLLLYNFYTRSLQFLLKLLFEPKPKELGIKIVR